MAQLTTDSSVLAKEAANFERIADELKTVTANVERVANELEGKWYGGHAAAAAQGALARFRQAADAQVQELNNISTNVTNAGAHYSATDDEQAAALAAAMNMNGDDSKKHNGIRLVDWKQSPTPAPGPGHTGQDAHDAIKNLPEGTRPFIKEVHSEQDLRNLWKWLTEGAPERAGSSNYPGTERVLNDGTIVGIRPNDQHGPTVDIRYPGNEGNVKVHINTARGGLPDIPIRAAGPPEGAAPGARAPVESPPVGRPAPPVGRAPGGIGGGPMDPNSLPHVVQLPHSHHGPAVLGRDDVADLPEFDPG